MFLRGSGVRSALRWPRRKGVSYGVTALLGFELELWDYITFAAMFVLVAAGTVLAILIAGLPGRIAIARKHPEAEAVKIMGWAGLLPVWPWMQAFIWAFKPTDVVDIRRFPPEERQATE